MKTAQEWLDELAKGYKPKSIADWTPISCMANAQRIAAIQADAREGMVAREKLRPTVVDLRLWVERRLQSLEHRDTSTRNPSTGQVKSNGFAFSAVPDWELRQKLESIIALETLLGEKGGKS